MAENGLNLRFPIEEDEVFRNKGLTNGIQNVITDNWPLGGEGWIKLKLTFEVTVVIGTGTGAISEAIMRYIKGVSARTDKGERLYDLVPARDIYRQDQAFSGTAPRMDTITAANGTYKVDVNLWFIDPKMVRPLDTIVDTGRYKSFTLEILLGTISDLFTTPGTATVSTVVHAVVERIKGHDGKLPEGALPIEYMEVKAMAPVNPANGTEISLDKLVDYRIKRLFVFTGNNATAGVQCSGDATANVIKDITVETDRDKPRDGVLVDMVNTGNKQDYAFETAVTGLFILDFVKDGSRESALKTWLDKSGGKQPMGKCRVYWTNDTLSTSQVTVLAHGLKPLAA